MFPFFEPLTLTAALNATRLRFPEPAKEKLPEVSNEPLTYTWPPTSPAPIDQLALKSPYTRFCARPMTTFPEPGKPPRLIGILVAAIRKSPAAAATV